MAAWMGRIFADEAMEVVPDRAVAIERNGDSVTVVTARGRRLDGDAVLVATGRTPRVAGLNLEVPG